MNHGGSRTVKQVVTRRRTEVQTVGGLVETREETPAGSNPRGSGNNETTNLIKNLKRILQSDK